MLAWIGGEHLLKIRATYGQHDFVRMQEFAIAGQCYIDQITAIEQIQKARCNIFLSK